MSELPDHLKQKYNLYAIQLESGINKRPGQTLLMVHIGRPVSLGTVCRQFIFHHIELTLVKTGEKILTSSITGVQKIPNDNKPDYELTLDGNLNEIGS